MVYERDYRGLPERRDLTQRPSFWQDENNKNTKRYILYRNQEEFYKAYDTEEYRQSLNYKSLEPLRASILAKKSECGQRDEKEFIEALKEAQASKGMEVETKLGNCLCKSTWCKKCHKLFYIPKYKDYIQQFDHTKTRHVILTTDRDKFSDGLNALKIITDKKSLSAFIRKLRNGKKIKVGDQWEWLHLPIKMKQALGFLEFYDDGFPHWHFLIEVEKEGKAGMIGGKNLHRSWAHGIVKETYFRNLDHWKSIAGYFADKGYFEKGKEYQTELPKDIKEHYGRRIRRITYYPGQKEGVHEEERIDITEEEAFQEVAKYFDDKNQEPSKNTDQKEINKKEVNYQVILSKCGTRTYIRAVVNRRLIEMFVPVSFNLIRDLIKPVYTKGHGYVCSLTIDAIRLIAANSERIIEHHETQYHLFDDDDCSDDLESSGGPIATEGDAN